MMVFRTLIFGFGKTQKYEDAAEAFVKAGNAYKLANLWQSAGSISFYVIYANVFINFFC